MDTSDQYIKMCDCPEIQDKWEQSQAGDFYFMRDSLFHPTKITGNYNGDGWKLLPRTTNYGWLPRQDQIQEMMRKNHENTLDMLCNFYAVITVDQPTGFQQMFEVSMEQLWLVFYMYKKHQKKWNGKKWVA